MYVCIVNYNKMKAFRFLFYSFILITISFQACKKSESDDIPVQQQILTYDTSGLTGQLNVYVKYLDPYGSIQNATNSNVFLYASREDIAADLSSQNFDLAIYRLTTGSGNTAYFGYINYGNYYVLGFNTINGYYYEKVSIVQVRPQQQEELTITLLQSTTK